MDKFLMVFLGGGCGTIARYTTMTMVNRIVPTTNFPWATLVVNLIGAIIIGFMLELLMLRTNPGDNAKLLYVTGFLGGYTTFSAFSLDAMLMIERSDYLNSFVYVTASVVGTVLAVFMGSQILKYIQLYV